ncbi:MAG: hypothetical protein D6820_12985 [Lentisphaerae bacterium]|nr:MAG: hypothetical protein D6820_12985 [Lentisphaerota bacterium]
MLYVIRLSWIIFLCFMGIMLECALARWQIIFSGGLFIACYLGIAQRIQTGIIAGFITAEITQVLFDRRITMLPDFLLAMVILIYFKHYGDRRSLFNQLSFGFFFSAAACAYLLVAENIDLSHGWSLISFQTSWTLLSRSILVGSLLYPLLIRCCDGLAHLLALERFQPLKPDYL